MFSLQHLEGIHSISSFEIDGAAKGNFVYAMKAQHRDSY